MGGRDVRSFSFGGVEVGTDRGDHMGVGHRTVQVKRLRQSFSQERHEGEKGGDEVRNRAFQSVSPRKTIKRK